MKSTLSVLRLIAVALVFAAGVPAISGCGNNDLALLGAYLSGKPNHCIDDLEEDLDDAEDNEDVGEAWDDFEDCD